MKLLYVISLFFFCTTSLFAQEFIKRSTIHFKDATTASGDFYYYPALEQQVTLVDSLGKKQEYDLASVDYIQGQNDLYIVLDFNGTPRLFETIVKGEKASLYKTNIRNSNQFYVLKDNQVTWLEGGEVEFEKEGKKYRKENNRYKGTLKFLLNDNAYVADKIEKLQYFESSFIPLFMVYNNGYISYVKTKDMEKQQRIPNWKIYAQYSIWRNTPSLYDEYTVSRFFQAGTQYYMSEGSKHSFKIGFEYGLYNTSTKFNGNWWNINTSYYYDVFRMPRGNVYFGARLFDIGKANTTTYKDFYLLPRLSPLLGYEHHISQKTNLFVELNQLFLIGSNPLNFSFGVSYDL